MAGGSQTKTELPAWYQKYAEKSLAQADKIAQIGYRPNVGPDIAAFNPTQVAGMQGANDWAAAFGGGTGQGGNTPVDVAASLPQATTYAGGIQGLSSYPMYEEAMKKFAAMFPGQSDYIKGFSIDPQTGAPASQYEALAGMTNGSGGGGGGGGGRRDWDWSGGGRR